MQHLRDLPHMIAGQIRDFRAGRMLTCTIIFYALKWLFVAAYTLVR